MTSGSTANETFESKLNENIEEAVTEGERMFARTWKFIVAEGIAAIAFGFVLLVWPDIGLTTLVALVAVYLLVTGFLSGIAAFSMPLTKAERGWLAVQAVLGVGFGIAMLIWNDISAEALLYVIAAWAIVFGLLLLGSAFELPLSGGRRLLLALEGIVFGAFGAIMFIEPEEGALAQIALVAAFAIVTGVLEIGFALELRKVAAEVKRAFARPTTAGPVTHG
jgi:uncharacterized membrane protein HdeD (DUF308 family)